MGKIMAAERPNSQIDQTQNPISALQLFSGNANKPLAERIAKYLGIELGKLTCTKFSDGEIRVKIEESVRGNDVFIILPTCSPVNDNVMELLILLDALRRASANRITVVVPYYGYARQDKKIKPREPVTASLVANLITVAGASRVVSIDLHAEQIQGFFDIPVDHLYGGPIIGKWLVQQGYYNDDVCVVSPDVAGVSRAKFLAEMLNAPLAIIAKRRPEPNKVDIIEIIGKVHGKRCVLIDDMIDTGGSVICGAKALIERGAKEVIASCTHAVFSGTASQDLQDSPITKVICMDTIPLPKEKCFEKLVVLPAAPLLGEAIRRIHSNESVSEMFVDWRWQNLPS
jgi:ribose-phosphate pyrophosphokinase